MILEYNLQFFAKEGAGGEKTEAATPYLAVLKFLADLLQIN